MYHSCTNKNTVICVRCRLPLGLEDVSKYPNLIVELLIRGWTEENIRKLTGNNLLRALEEAEVVRIYICISAATFGR